MVAAGKDADCCLAIDCNLDGEQLTWVTDIFGTDFIVQVKAVASQGDQSDGIAVRFLSLSYLACLSFSCAVGWQCVKCSKASPHCELRSSLGQCILGRPKVYR